MRRIPATGEIAEMLFRHGTHDTDASTEGVRNDRARHLDTEGGDDLMAQNAAIDRNAGAGGFELGDVLIRANVSGGSPSRLYARAFGMPV